MQTLHISRQELHTRGGVLDRMLDSLFDTAILVDTDCRILYISASSFPDPSQRAAVVGQHISVLDQLSPFEEVLRTGQPRPDLFLELHGRPCISSLFPVLDGERVIGVVGTITVRNLGRLKKVLSQLSDQAAGFRGLYQDLARVDSGYRLEDFVGESPGWPTCWTRPGRPLTAVRAYSFWGRPAPARRSSPAASMPSATGAAPSPM